MNTPSTAEQIWVEAYDAFYKGFGIQEAHEQAIAVIDKYLNQLIQNRGIATDPCPLPLPSSSSDKENLKGIQHVYDEQMKDLKREVIELKQAIEKLKESIITNPIQRQMQNSSNFQCKRCGGWNAGYGVILCHCSSGPCP